MHTATYSPEDNKLRLYASSRLDNETWAALKAAGFKWAPRQELFVAPMWTPEREDLLVELAGEVGDEDTSLVDRQEERAERFEGYSDNRAKDAAAAHKAADAISERFYGGQPILVGHHSEKRARKDQARMHGLMSKTVKMWETSQYWAARAAGALRHAKYKERPDVRARRIKGLEKEERKQLNAIAHAKKLLKFWGTNPDMEKAKKVANYFDRGGITTDAGERHWSLWSALDDGKVSLQNAIGQRLEGLPKAIAYHERWLAHYQGRLVYERAMLEEDGGLVGARVDLQVGGRVLIRREWSTIVRINKKGGKPVSVTTNARYVSVRGIEEIEEYKAPTAEHAAAVAAAMKPPPLCNYAGEGFATCTKEQWEKIPKDYKGSERIDGTEKVGRHRVRHALGVYVNVTGDWNARHKYWNVFVSDLPVKMPPGPDKPRPPGRVTVPPEPVPYERSAPAETPAAIDVGAIKAALKAGPAPVIAVPQLFATPAAIAERMVEVAGIDERMRVLEPSAGSGNLLRAIEARKPRHVTAVEVNMRLCDALEGRFGVDTLMQADFLSLKPSDVTPSVDRVVMNPPFERGADIRHIKHAMGMLGMGGRLVALCADGPRQREAFEPIATSYEPLPAGTFKDQGTNVNVAMVVIDV